MPNDGWSNSFDKVEPLTKEAIVLKGMIQIAGEEAVKIIKDTWDFDLTPSREVMVKQGSNLVDSEAYLYFQCEKCQGILDPHTKSFAKLQQNRVDKGWLCVWNVDGMGYKVYCPKCGDGK